MYESNLHRDVVTSEMDYRLGRIRAEFAGRRRRRTLARRSSTGGAGGAGDIGWTTVR